MEPEQSERPEERGQGTDENRGQGTDEATLSFADMMRRGREVGFWDAVMAAPDSPMPAFRPDAIDALQGLQDAELHLEGELWEGGPFAEAFESHDGPLMVIQQVDADNEPREILRLRIEDGKLIAEYDGEDLDEAARMFVQSVTRIELQNSEESRTNVVHEWLVQHNLRAIPGNVDGLGLYGLPSTAKPGGYVGYRGKPPPVATPEQQAAADETMERVQHSAVSSWLAARGFEITPVGRKRYHTE